MGGHPEHQPGDDVDEQDQQRRNRIALHELAGAIHRTVEIGLGGDFAAARLGLVRGEQAGRKIGVDRHLLARERVEGEARRDFGDAARALGDHHQIDDHQDQEHKDADGEIAADQESAEGLDDHARSRLALVAVEQHDSRRGDVERQTQQRGKQQDRGEGREIERLLRIHRRHQHRDRQRDIEHEEQVEQDDRDRHHHQQDDRENADRKGERRAEDLARAHRPNAFNLP